MTAAEHLQRAVALEFEVPCSTLDHRAHRAQQRDITIARHVWVYLLVQFPPVGIGSPKGNIKGVAQLLNLHPSGVRYALRRVEDERDDPVFDARISALEAAMAGA